jgi:hypothetical protein
MDIKTLQVLFVIPLKPKNWKRIYNFVNDFSKQFAYITIKKIKLSVKLLGGYGISNLPSAEALVSFGITKPTI